MSINKLFILREQIIYQKEAINRLKTHHLRELREIRDGIMGPVQYFQLIDGTLGTEDQLTAEIPF